ncbi:hypothetical protein I4U23_011546 [Adineta vaga]|nr:hypothetical protein I4U23_011546 [Adineta vaga]
MAKLTFPPNADADDDNNNSSNKNETSDSKEIETREEFLSALIKLQNFEIPTDNNFQEHEDLLKFILNYANLHFQSPKYSQSIHSLFSALPEYSNKTILVPCLIQTNYPESLLKWLKLISKEQLSDVERLVGTIYNISRHDNGVQVLNSLNTTNQLKDFLVNHPDIELKIMCAMTTALLSTPEQIKTDRKRMNNILDQLLKIIIDASKRSPKYVAKGWHISEPLIVLVRLICYDRTLDYILQHAQVEIEQNSMVKFFIDIFLQFHKNVEDNDSLKLSTCTALCNILWSISLRQQYKDELEENKQLKNLLEKITNEKIVINPIHYVPKYMENIQKAAEGILCNMKNDDDQGKDNERLNSIKKKPSIMISYAHSDNHVCSQLYNELNKYEQNFDIWIDWKNTKTGYLWGKIADGITDANIILCLLSTKYYESKSCQQEFVYAHDHLKKSIIPIFILDDKPPGWLAIHTCMMKYVRFRNIKQLEQEKLKDLIGMIEENLFDNNLKKDQYFSHQSLPVHHEETYIEYRDLSQEKVQQWNQNDIKQWFQQNKLSIDLWKLYQFENGTQLLNYATSLSNDEKIESQRQIYSEEFNEIFKGKRLLPHQFTTFAYALRKLYSEQNTNETKQQKSQTCVIS